MHKHRLELQTSRFANYYNCLIHLCASLLVLSLSYYQLFLLLLIIPIAYSFHHYSQTRITKIFIFENNHWILRDVVGVDRKAILLSNSCISSVFCLLNFKTQNQQKIRLAIFRDSLSTAEFRRLKVHITCHVSASGADKVQVA